MHDVCFLLPWSCGTNYNISNLVNETHIDTIVSLNLQTCNTQQTNSTKYQFAVGPICDGTDKDTKQK